MREEILRMENIFVYNLNRTILEDFRLYAFKGEILSLIGLSGQGKTALHNILSGESTIQKGKIIFNNKEYIEKQRINKNKDILCLGKEIILIDNLTVAENIFVIGNREYRNIFINYKHINYKTEKILAKYLPSVKSTMLIKELTYWQIRMVELCKALIMKPKLIVIDEAILTCSEEKVEEILNIITKLRDMGTSIIYESNRINRLTKISDRMFIIRESKNIKLLYNSQYSDILINNFLVGYDMPITYERQSIIQNENLLEFKNVYLENHIRNINISLKKGEIIGIFHNENVLNKKILDIIIGEEKIVCGEILFEDKKFNSKNIISAKKQGIGIVPIGLKDEYLIESMSVEDNLIIYFIKKFSKSGIFIDKKMVKFILKELKDMLNNSEYKEAINTSSYIEQLILLYREIICNNKILICVNPCERADIIMKKMIYSILNEAAKSGSGIIIIDNNIIELQEICDTIYIINNMGNLNKYKIK